MCGYDEHPLAGRDLQYQAPCSMVPVIKISSADSLLLHYFFPFSHAKMLSEIDHEHDSSKLSK